MLMTVMAMGVALALAWLVLPAFNAFSGKALSLGVLVRPVFLLILLATALVAGGLAGGYPAMVLSQFRPIGVLRGPMRASRHGNVLRKGLVVFQFSLSIALMIGTAVVFSQLDHMRRANLGFDDAHLLTVNFHADADVQQQAEALKQAFRQRIDITAAAVSGDIPGTGNLHAGVRVEDSAQIRRCIIDKDVRVPAGERIGHNLDHDRGRFTVTENGIVVVPKGYRFS